MDINVNRETRISFDDTYSVEEFLTGWMCFAATLNTAIRFQPRLQFSTYTDLNPFEASGGNTIKPK